MVVGMYYKIVDLSTLIGINNKNKSRTNSMLYYNYFSKLLFINIFL